MTDSRPGARGTYVSEADPLYKALDAYEDAAGAVGVQTITTQGAYRQLTDAIGGHGDLQEASVRFQLEASILTVQFGDWSEAARALTHEVKDGADWQRAFMRDRLDAAADLDARDHHGNPFEEVARQPYGERGVIATEDV
jgi:hypothetical protein